jgi:hypothetical protein
MNLKSVAMATGLVLTFAAGAWLSTIMLAPPQRSNRVAVQNQAPAPSPQLPPARLPQGLPERLPDLPASDSILPPLPPLPPAPAHVRPAPPPVAELPPVEPPVIAAPEPLAVQAAQPQEAQPPAPAPAMAEAPAPEPPPADPVVEAAVAEPPVPAVPLVPPVITPPEADIDPGIAALSDLVARTPSAPPPAPPHRATPAAEPFQPTPPLAQPAPSTASVTSPVTQAAGPYFTIQVGSFQDPANAATLVRSLGVKGWEAFVVDWANSTGQIWKVVRVGRYQTEAQAVSASAELMSAANLRGNVIKVR